jgi:hypothetical protein
MRNYPVIVLLSLSLEPLSISISTSALAPNLIMLSLVSIARYNTREALTITCFLTL